MPSPIGHMLSGVFIGLAAKTEPGSFIDPRRLAIASFAAAAADLDLILVLAGYDWTAVHRTFSHSLVLAGFVTLLLYGIDRLLKLRVRAGIPYVMIGACLFCHIGMDLLGEDVLFPYGLMLFWPISEKFFYPGITLFVALKDHTNAAPSVYYLMTAVARECIIVTVFGLALVALIRGYSSKGPVTSQVKPWPMR
jgi:membrane-bound metal-dependent hydrolase YbcI (DUF457 family)